MLNVKSEGGVKKESKEKLKFYIYNIIIYIKFIIFLALHLTV